MCHPIQKQPSRVVLIKSCSENMQQIYMKTPCRSVISIKFQSNFIEITLRDGCSTVNLLHISRTTFSKNTSEGLLLSISPFFSIPHSSLFFSHSFTNSCTNFFLKPHSFQEKKGEQHNFLSGE